MFVVYITYVVHVIRNRRLNFQTFVLFHETLRQS